MKDITKLLGMKGLWIGVAIGAGVVLLATQVLGLGKPAAPQTTSPTIPATNTSPPGHPGAPPPPQG
jgi:hypothetical protein